MCVCVCMHIVQSRVAVRESVYGFVYTCDIYEVVPALSVFGVRIWQQCSRCE